MTTNIDAINFIVNKCANFYSPYSKNLSYDQTTKNTIINMLNNQIKTDNLLIEDIFADISTYSIIIHEQFREILNNKKYIYLVYR